MGVDVRVICMIRGCGDPAEFFMRRRLRGGDFQSGLVCDRHEHQYAKENLRKLGVL